MGRKKQVINRPVLILEAATALFRQYGYEKTTLDEIAETAGISKGSIYLEFESKEDILFAVVSKAKAEQLAEMQAIAESAYKDYVQTIQKMLMAHLATIYESVNKHHRNTEGLVMASFHLRGRLKDFFEAREAILAELLEKAVLNQEITASQNYTHLAQLILRCLRGVLPPYYELNAPIEEILEEARQILTMVFEGLRYHSMKQVAKTNG